jgi:hypothetical protein
MYLAVYVAYANDMKYCTTFTLACLSLFYAFLLLVRLRGGYKTLLTRSIGRSIASGMVSGLVNFQ